MSNASYTRSKEAARDSRPELASSRYRKGASQSNAHSLHGGEQIAAAAEERRNADLTRVLDPERRQANRQPRYSRSPDSQGDEDLAHLFKLSKIYAATAEDSKNEIKTPVNLYVGSRYELMGAGGAKTYNKAIIGSLDTDLRRHPPEDTKSEVKASAIMPENRSNQIFNIYNKDTFNMLLNYDKYQNPVDLLRAKFDIVSGPTNLTSEGAPQLFGHTPLGGTTLVHKSPALQKHVVETKKELRKGKKPHASPREQETSKKSILKTSVRERLVKNMSTVRPAKKESDWEKQFHPLPPGVARHQRSNTVHDGPINLMDPRRNGAQVENQESPPAHNQMRQMMPLPYHTYLPNIFKPGGQDPFNTIDLQHRYGASPSSETIQHFGADQRKKVRKGFGVANKTQQALIVIDRPGHAKAGYKFGDSSFNASSTLGPAFGQSLNTIRRPEYHHYLDRGLYPDLMAYERHNRSTLVPSSPFFEKKINKNIQNGRIDVIQRQWEAKIKKLEQPMEILSRHPEELKKYREQVRNKRYQEMKELLGQDQRLPVLSGYQRLSPSEYGSFQNSRTTMLTPVNRDGAKPAYVQLLKTYSPASTATGGGVQQMSQILMKNVSSDLASGSLNSIKKLGAHQGNFVAGADLATYLSRQPKLGAAAQKNDNNIYSTQLNTVFQETEGRMMNDGKMAMARIHSEAFRYNKDFVKEDEAGHQNIQNFHEMSFNYHSHRKLEDESVTSPGLLKYETGEPVMINLDSRVLLVEPPEHASTTVGLTQVQMHRESPPLGPVPYMKSSPGVPLSLGEIGLGIDRSSFKLLDKQAGASGGVGVAQIAEGRAKLIGPSQVSSKLFKYSDVKQVLNKTIRKLEKTGGDTKASKMDKLEQRKKLQLSDAKKATKDDEQQSKVTREESAKMAGAQDPQLDHVDTELQYTTLGSQSAGLDGPAGRMHSTFSEKESFQLKQKKEFLLKLTDEGFGYNQDQLADAKMVLEAESKNFTIGASSNDVIMINFEEREKKARLDKVSAFRAQDNPVMSFGADTKSKLYRKEGDLLAEMKDIRARGRAGLQRLPFETARARKNKIVENFASCAPVLRRSKLDGQAEAQGAATARARRKGQAIAGRTPAEEDNVVVGQQVLTKAESSKPKLEPRFSQLSLASKTKSRHSKQAHWLSAHSEDAAEEKVSEKEEELEQDGEAEEASKYIRDGKPVDEAIWREISEFENKYKIKLSSQYVIEMIDERIASKDGMYSPPGKDKNQSLAEDAQSQNEDVSAQNASRGTPLDAGPVYGQEDQAAARIKRGKVQRLGGTRRQKQSKLAAEVMAEEQKKLGQQAQATAQLGLQMQDTAQKTGKRKNKCSCGVKDFIKELLRKLRGFEDRLPEFKEDLQLKREGLPTNGVLKGCRHDQKKERKAEERLEALEWFGVFVEDLHYCAPHRRVERPVVFRAFVKSILEDENMDMQIEKLKKYMLDNDMMSKEKIVDYVDFFDYNRYMVMKKKDKQKLKAGQRAKIELEASGDSSLDESEKHDAASLSLTGASPARQRAQRSEADEIFATVAPRLQKMVEKQLKATIEAEQARQKSLVAYRPDPITGLNENKVLDEPDKGDYRYKKCEFLDVFFDRQVVISDKMYKNFLGKLLPEEADLEIFKMDEATKRGDKKELLRSYLQEATRDALKHVHQTLESLKLAKQEKEAAMTSRYQTKKETETRKPSKQIKALQQALDDDLPKQEHAARTKFDNERKREAEKQRLLMQQQQSKTTPEGSPAIQPRPQPTQHAIASRKTSTDSTTAEIKLYEKERYKQVFYQLAKFFVEHPDDNYEQKDALLVGYYQDCLRGVQSDGSNFAVALPKPHFLNMVNDRVLSITNQCPSNTVCNALKNLLILAEKNKVQDYQIRKLIVDDTTMDDKKLELIMQGLAVQSSLKSVVLMNCQLGWASGQRLLRLLERDDTAEVEEFRLINVKMKIDNVAMKQLLNNAMEYEAADSSLVGKQNDYKRPLLGTLLKHMKNNMKRHVLIKRLQLSWMSLHTTWEPYCDLDCSRYLVKLIEADRGSQLEELDLSNCYMSLPQMHKISEALTAANENLRYLSLKGLNLLEMANMHNQANFAQSSLDMIDGIVENLIDFIEHAPSLQHLDLSCMGLGRFLIRIGQEGIRKSKSLLSVHLSQNNLALLDVEEFLEIMEIDHSEILTQIRKSMGAVEQEDTIGRRGQPCDSVKMMTYIAKSSKGRPAKVSPSRRPPRQFGSSDYVDIVQYLQTDLERQVNQERLNLKQVLNNGEHKILYRNLCNRLVIQRKRGFALNLFNDSVQSKMFSYQRHFGLSQLDQRWQARLREEECYVCNKYQNYRIFYTRSRAHQQFTKIDDPSELSALRLHLKFHDQDKQSTRDPYRGLPLLLGSILDQDIPSLRLMNVKHQAALLWAMQQVRAMKGKNIEEKQEKRLREYISAVQILMKDGVPKKNTNEQEIEDNRAEIEELMQHFVDWREQLGIKHGFSEYTGDLQEKKNSIIINYPIFAPKEEGEDENDIFYLEGFFKPGTHQIIIYDPKIDSFFKRENILVAPRKVDLKTLKSDPGPSLTSQPPRGDAQEEMTQVYFEQMKGPSMKLVQAHLFGDLLHDMSPQISEMAFENDFDGRLVELKRYMGRSEEAAEQAPGLLLAEVRRSYQAILKLWRCAHYRMTMRTPSHWPGDFFLRGAAHILYTVIKNSSLAKEMDALRKLMEKDPLLQVLQEVHDTIRTDQTGAVFANTLQDPDEKQRKMTFAEYQRAAANEQHQRALLDNFGHMMPTRQEVRQPCYRRTLPLALLRVCSLISEKVAGAGDPRALFERYIRQINGFLSDSSHVHDLKELRKALIFKNKPLATFLKLNKQLIRKSLYENYFCGYEGLSTKSFTIYPRTIRGKYSLPSSLQLLQLDLNKVTRTMALPQAPTEITLDDEEGDEPAVLARADVSFETLTRLALESKMSLVQQELEGPTHAEYLTFEEFTLFLCQLASYIYDVDARVKHDRSGPDAPDSGQANNIFLLSAYAKTGSKKPAHMQMALSLQNLLMDLKKHRALDESHFQLQEMDLAVFQPYLDIIPPSNVSASAMGLAGQATSQAVGEEEPQIDDQESRLRALRQKKARQRDDSSDYTDGYDV